MATAQEEALLTRPQVWQDGVQLTKVESIKIHRVKFLDEIYGTLVYGTQGASTVIPFDIDDLEIPDNVIRTRLNADAQSDEDREKVRLEFLEFLHQESYNRNFLNWQRVLDERGEAYYKNVDEYIRQVISLYSEKNKSAFKTLTESIQIQDITQFTTIEGITRDMKFGNRATINISIQELQKLMYAVSDNPHEQTFTPRENDVLEINLRYHDGKVDRTFLGLVSGISFQEEQGRITGIVVAAYGLSKLLQVTKMSVSRGVVGQYRGKALRQLPVTFWAANQFAGMTVDEIFNSVVINQLAMEPISGSANIGAQNAALIQEGDMIVHSLIPDLEEEIVSREKRLGTNKSNLIAPIIEETQIQWSVDDAFQEVRDEKQKTLEGIEQTYGGFFQSNKKFKDFSDQNKFDALQIMQRRVLINALRVRLEWVQKERQAVNQKIQEHFDQIQVDYRFDIEAFRNDVVFELIYIPLINIAAVRANMDKDNQVVAKFKGIRAYAFDRAIRNGWDMWFSQLQSPAEILEAIRAQAKHVVYENEDNQIIAEIPRYNDFSADPGETIEEFIITNPLNTESIKQDIDMVTRLDTKVYWGLIGALKYLWGSYIDPAILARYGMRPEPPSHNPNAVTPALGSLFSAIEMVNRNSATRTIEAEVFADRKYKLGRLYFMARKSFEEKIGSLTVAEGNTQDMDGYVGYLWNYNTTSSYGSPISHKLTFNYVRKAKLIFETQNDKIKEGGRITANFKILPDIGALINAWQKAYEEGRVPDPDKRPPYVSSKVITPNIEDTPLGNVAFTEIGLQDQIREGGPIALLYQKSASRGQFKNSFATWLRTTLPALYSLLNSRGSAYGPVQTGVPFAYGQYATNVRETLKGSVS